MGRDVDAIGNHTLRTDNLVFLAEDISVRLNCKIKYGYVNDQNLDDDFLFKEQGSFGNGEPVYYVHDTYHFQRLTDPDKYANMVCYEIALERDYEEYSTYIFRDSFIADAYYDNRWWGLCRVFTGEYEYTELTENFRNAVYEEVKLFGGDFAIYIDDQAEGNNHTFDLEELGMNEFLQNLKRDGSILDISLWVESGMSPLNDYSLAFIDDFKSLGAIKIIK